MDARAGLRRWALPETSGAELVIDDEKLGSLGKWMAAGFTLLTGVLTFLGVTEGVLDRILRTDPRPALLAMCLVGAGVLSGLVAPVLKVERRMRLVVPLAAVAVLGLFSLVAFPDIPSGEDAWIGLGATVLLAGAIVCALVLLRDVLVPLVVAALLVGLSALAFGLYGVAKLAVLSKTPTEPVLTATASASEAGGHEVEVAVTAGGLDDGAHLRAEAYVSWDDDSAELVAATVLHPGADGTIDSTWKFAVPQGRHSVLSIRAARCTAAPCVTDDEHELVRASVGPLHQERPLLVGHLAVGASAETLDLAVDGRSLPRGSRVQIELIGRTSPGGPDEVLLTATAKPDVFGEFAWTSSVQSRPATEFRLQARACTADRCEDSAPLASYRSSPPAAQRP